MMTCRPLLLITLALVLPVAAAPEAVARAPIDLAALIECRQGVADHAALAAALATPLDAVAHGLQPLPQTNPFMTEYRLARPLSVFGQPTEQIAVAGASVMAVLDLPDPRALAATLQLDAAVDQPDKFMAGRELVSRDVTDPATGEAQIESVILSLSTVKSHPGKTLAGCTYSLDLPAEPAPATPPKPAATPPGS